MSLFIYAGSMQFVTVDLLLSAFNPLAAFFLTLMVNARHLFYGISLLEKYKSTGWKKLYLIFGMLVVYCLKDAVFSRLHCLPELIAIAFIVVLHKWKKNTLLSIAGGTVLYMFLVQSVFV